MAKLPKKQKLDSYLKAQLLEPLLAAGVRDLNAYFLTATQTFHITELVLEPEAVVPEWEWDEWLAGVQFMLDTEFGGNERMAVLENIEHPWERLLAGRGFDPLVHLANPLTVEAAERAMQECDRLIKEAVFGKQVGRG